MADLKSLARHKLILKKRTPKFIRRGALTIKRLEAKWRKPRGFQSKARKYKKGKPRMVAIGFKTPKALQNVLPSGYRERRVSNIQDLKLLDPKTEVAVLSSSVGKKKSLIILEEAQKLGVSFSNIKVDVTEKAIKDYLALRKKVKKERAEKAKARKTKDKVKSEGKKKDKKTAETDSQQKKVVKNTNLTTKHSKKEKAARSSSPEKTTAKTPNLEKKSEANKK